MQGDVELEDDGMSSSSGGEDDGQRVGARDGAAEQTRWQKRVAKFVGKARVKLPRDSPGADGA